MIVDINTGEIFDTRPLRKAIRQKRNYRSRYGHRRQVADAQWMLVACSILVAAITVLR